jgi:hypothetical protein
MPLREELQRMDVNVLAVYCQRVAETHTTNSMVADRARQLKQEWTLFVSPTSPDLRTQQEVEAERVRLRQRMVSFLSVVQLPPLAREATAQSN